MKSKPRKISCPDIFTLEGSAGRSAEAVLIAGDEMQDKIITRQRAMPCEIHPTAIIANGALIDAGVSIGPYAVIGPHVRIGKGTSVGPHAIIDGFTAIGADCQIFAGASIGLEPQDLSYRGQETGVTIGDRVHIREYVTIHRGSKEPQTVIGDDCFLMNYVHIGHDSKVGNGVIMVNNSTLGGHVVVGDFAIFSGMCLFHQFVRVGRMAMTSGMCATRQDVPPFSMCDGRPLVVRGINTIGMRRQKVASPQRTAIKECYRLLYRAGLNITQACERIENDIEPFSEVKELVEFFRSSKRGVISRAFEDTSVSGSIEME